MNPETYKREFVDSLITPVPKFPIMVKLADCIRTTMRKTFVVADVNGFNVHWLNACKRYTSNLSIEDAYTLKGYTRHGDELINSALRGTEWTTLYAKLYALGLEFAAPQLFRFYKIDVTPMYDAQDNTLTAAGLAAFNELVNRHQLHSSALTESAQNTIQQILKIYVYDLSRIISAAPKLETPIVTFRGIKDDYLQSIKSVNVNAGIKGFQSTSYSPDIAYEFKGCYIYEIIITPGTPCIALEGISRYAKEREILIGLNVHSHVDALESKLYLDTTHLNYEHNDVKYKFTEPEYIYEQLFNPWNKNSEQVRVRRITIVPRKEEPIMKLHTTRETRRHKMRGGNWEIVMDNGAVLTPTNRKMSLRDKMNLYNVYKHFGISPHNEACLNARGIYAAEMEALQHIPLDQLDDTRVPIRFTRRAHSHLKS